MSKPWKMLEKPWDEIEGNENKSGIKDTTFLGLFVSICRKHKRIWTAGSEKESCKECIKNAVEGELS